MAGVVVSRARHQLYKSMAPGAMIVRDKELPDRLVFFTTDEGYLVPTLVAALQVAAQVTAERIADVAIFLIDYRADAIRGLRAEFPQLHFHSLEAETFRLPDTATFNKTHVPRSALARLVVGEHVDRSYKQLVYLDGDIQIVGDIRPLLRIDVPEGALLAAPDIAEVVWPEVGAFAKHFRSYVLGLGISDPRRYFNSGVIVMTGETWRAIGPAAFRYMAQHSHLCRFHDQSSLNRVIGDQRIALSPLFNFTSLLQALAPERREAAVILHFTGGEKPWSCNARPETASLASEYVSLVERHPMLLPYWARTSGRGAEDASYRAPRASLASVPRALRMMMRRWRVKKILRTTQYIPPLGSS